MERSSRLEQGSTGPRVCFVIPTYNEAGNITQLLQRLAELYPGANMLFLIVDDKSPDGTGRLVREFAAGDDRVHLLEGKRRGLGAAYIRGIGYALERLAAEVVALLHRLIHAGARVVEEPIYFRDRDYGVTKLGLDSMLEFVYHIWWLRLTTHRTFLKFCVTGLSGVVVNLGSFHLLMQLGLHRYLASPIAIEISIVSNFVINNYWTFADRMMIGDKRIRGVKFNVVSFLALAVSYSTFLVLSLLFPRPAPVFLQGLAIVPSVLVNYFLNSYWTFRESDRRRALNGERPPNT